MDELLLIAVPVALVAATAALVKPARRRIMPVANAAGRAGLAVAEVSVAGARGIVDAAIHGESKQAQKPSGGSRAASGTTPSAGARRGGPTKASSGRARRRSPSSAASQRRG